MRNPVIDVATSYGKIDIGKQGENLTNAITFDCAAWLDGLTGGVLSIVHQRPGDTDAYPVANYTTSETALLWLPNETDLAFAGIGQCELRYTIGSAIAKSKTFLTVIERGLAPLDTPPEAYVPYIDRVIEATDAAIAHSDALTELYGSLRTPKETAWAQGTISATSGNGSVSTTRIRMSFSQDISQAVCDDGYLFRVYAYNDEGYVGVMHTDGTYKKTSSGIQDLTSFTFTSEYVYRIVMLKTSGEDISVEESAHITLYGLTDKTLSVKDKAADAEKVGEAVKAIGLALADEEAVMPLLDGLSAFKNGYAINNSGEEVEYSASYCTIDYYPVKSARVRSSVTLVSSTAYYHFVAFYSANKTYIGRVGGLRNGTVLANAPSGAEYFKVSLTSVGNGNVDTYAAELTYPHNITLSPKGKWYIFGDSISAGYFSVTDEEAEANGWTISYRPDGLSGVGSVWDKTLEHTYWGYANKWYLQKEIVKCAQPGQGYLRIASNDKNGIIVVSETDVSDADLITVAWGFNDWHYKKTRGNHDLIDESVPYPVEGYDTSQITTINQAIWYCLGELIRKAPNARIVVQTPMNGWLYGGDFSTNWGIGYALNNSGKLSDIHDDIKYWADYYGLQVLEMTYNNSAVNRRNIQTALLDGSHPSNATHKQLGHYVATALHHC